MFSRPRNWLSGGLWKPKNPHSLDYLKYLYSVLGKNQTVTDNNRSLLVETLRSMSEILIWGDQNDSTVFDFFLEKSMLSFFLRYLRQKSGRYICVQLLQTLNILFENISNETSLYYLLSNNHVNSIIVHKFDFSDEEVMAYYISFLKTLSLKLNKHTIHFFYNEHTNDFALYTEAIKFFNHSESMVRIAVRTITLNVFKVDDESMLSYVRDKTAAPYFSNLVWFIGNHILEVDSCVRNNTDHQSRGRLSDIVAEHLNHLHYLNDIFSLKIDKLNDVLTDHLLKRLLIPLYLCSLKLDSHHPLNEQPHVSPVVSLFLLSQVYLIMSDGSLMRQLTLLVFGETLSVLTMQTEGLAIDLHPQTPGFIEPPEPLAQTLDNNRGAGRPVRRPNYSDTDEPGGSSPGSVEGNSIFYSTSDLASSRSPNSPDTNITDEEKLNTLSSTFVQMQHIDRFTTRPYFEAILGALECIDNDYEAIFGLGLLYALCKNKGVLQQLLDAVELTSDKSMSKENYNVGLVERLIKIITLSCQPASRVRLVTLEMCILLLQQLVYSQIDDKCYLQDRHLACVEGAKEEATLFLRNFYKSEEIFLDMFEDEYRQRQQKPLNVEYLYMDASLLLPPTVTPLTGIEFSKRLPCGEVERARRCIRVYFILRELSLILQQSTESRLPLTKLADCHKIEDVLDLNNSDLIACTIVTTDQKKERRFLVIDVLQLILVEPDTKRLGWGVVRFVGFLQDIEVTGDKEDSRSLHITIHRPSTCSHVKPVPLLAARFIFDDHIRCMAAKQRLTKGRQKARQRKMQMIARLLEFPSDVTDSPSLGVGSQRVHFGTNIRRPTPGTVLRVTRTPIQTHVMRSMPANSSRTLSQSSPVTAQIHGQPLMEPQPVSASASPSASPSSPITVYEGRERAYTNSSSTGAGVDVEEALDASSPSAFAFQVLGSPSPSQLSTDPKSSGNTKIDEADISKGIYDIPLQDLSYRHRTTRRLNSESDILDSKGSLHVELKTCKARSASSSPLRQRNHSGPLVVKSSSGASSSRCRSLSGDAIDRPGSSTSVRLDKTLTVSSAPPSLNDLKSLRGRLILVKARASSLTLKSSDSNNTATNAKKGKQLKKQSNSSNSGNKAVRNQVSAEIDFQKTDSHFNSPPLSKRAEPTSEITLASADLGKLELSCSPPGAASEHLMKLTNTSQTNHTYYEHDIDLKMSAPPKQPSEPSLGGAGAGAVQNI